MNKFLIGILGFSVGFGAGVLGTKAYFKHVYEQISQDEIDSVREMYGRKFGKDAQESEAEIEETANKPHLLRKEVDPAVKKSYKNIVRNLGYSDEENEEDHPSDSDPYVITPDEFDSKDDFDTISLIYYSDNVLADENGHAMTDSEIEASVGSESLTHFGEYEEDSVFVRNERRKADYEILKEELTYDEAVRLKPYAREDYK